MNLKQLTPLSEETDISRDPDCSDIAISDTYRILSMIGILEESKWELRVKISFSCES